MGFWDWLKSFNNNIELVSEEQAYSILKEETGISKEDIEQGTVPAQKVVETVSNAMGVVGNTISEAIKNPDAGSEKATSELTKGSWEIPKDIVYNNWLPKDGDNYGYTVIYSTSGYWVLPIPQSMDYESSYEWSSDDAHHISGGLARLGSTTKNFSFGNFLSNFGYGLAETAVGVAAQGTHGMIQKALTNMFGEAGYKEATRGAGVVYNPNKQLYFNGIDLRDFSLSFNLAPTSKVQSDAIRDGFKKLAVAAAPDYKLGKFFFTYPDFFGVAVILKIPGGEYTLLQRGGLAITNMNLDLASDGQITWHYDGFPTGLSFTVSFKESKVPTKANLSDIKLFGSSLG